MSMTPEDYKHKEHAGSHTTLSLSGQLRQYRLSKNHRDAFTLFRSLSEDQRAHPDVLTELALILIDRNQLNQAADCLYQIHQQLPDDPATLYNLAGVEKMRSEYPAGKEHLQRLLELQPDNALAHNQMGAVLHSLGESRAAIEHYGRALEIQPDYQEACANLAISQLQCGDHCNGWQSYQSRPARISLKTQLPIPEWLPGDNHQHRLLLVPEQGLGDEIMFCGFLPELRKFHQGTITAVCSDRLLPLLARSFPDIHWRNKSEGLHKDFVAKHFDNFLLYGSLPCKLGIVKPPCFDAYLKVDPKNAAGWRARFSKQRDSLNIGFSWRGGKDQETIRARSITLRHWRPLFNIPNTRWYSLQYGEHGDDFAEIINEFDNVHRFSTVDPCAEQDNFAALIRSLDRVVSVDNSTIHLTGALGARTRVLLPARADWRWGNPDTPCRWYKSVTPERNTDSDWQAFMNTLAQTLQRQWTASTPTG